MKKFIGLKARVFLVAFAFGFWLGCSKENSRNEELKEIVNEEGETETVDTSANKKSVGDSANDLLSDANYNELRLEFFYVEGFKPENATIENFENFLNSRLHKSQGISIELKPMSSQEKETYTTQEIRALEDSIRTLYNEDKSLAVFGIFLDGEYAENTENGSVLGIAYRNTSFVIFEETVQSFSGQTFGPSLEVLESTVLNHEFGHLLGMVNAGTPMQNHHQDEEHGRHCSDDNCLMYWTAETGEGLINMLSGGSIPEFDSQCLADLQANGGK